MHRLPIACVNRNDLEMSEAVWQAWTLILDPGVQYNTRFTPNRVVAGFTTVVGVFFAATMTGKVAFGYHTLPIQTARTVWRCKFMGFALLSWEKALWLMR